MAEALPKEQFLNRVLDSITDPLVIYDRDYRIVAVNQALATTYQVDIEHIPSGDIVTRYFTAAAACARHATSGTSFAPSGAFPWMKTTRWAMKTEVTT
jgi:PAS domain-containing protein